MIKVHLKHPPPIAIVGNYLRRRKSRRPAGTARHGIAPFRKVGISKLLDKIDMGNLKPSPTPMISGKILRPDEGEPLQNPTPYRSAIGGLQYLTFTRPDLSFSVNTLSQFMHAPTSEHWKALKRVLRYIKGTIHLGLVFKASGHLQIQGFSDADWGCNPFDRKSVAGYCVYLRHSLISWSSKKQQVVSRSSTESEYRALAHLAAEVLWLQSLLREMHILLPSKPQLYSDNIGAESLAQNTVFHARTKQIEIDVHFVRHHVLAGHLQVSHVSSVDQLADCLTKPVAGSQFTSSRFKLNVDHSPFSLRGAVEV